MSPMTRSGASLIAVSVVLGLKGAKARRASRAAADEVRAGLNGKTANAFGLAIPQSLLLRADQLIQ